YQLKLRNMQTRPRDFIVSIKGLPGAKMWDSMSSEADAAATLSIAAGPDRLETRRVLVRVPRERLGDEQTEFRFVVRAADGETDSRTTRFNGPEGAGTDDQ
ncbi:MAG: cytochrome c oxidase accessory protein CcoG, partial [Alphaproteobacteria bacterium]|nr:cytochrome c oxidase accessory protein CcoG [Alphaproteobacteria bacterium]